MSANLGNASVADQDVAEAFTAELASSDIPLPSNTADELLGLNAFRADPRFAGIDGSGLSVVVIDTGIDLDHPFFGPDADGNGVADRIVYGYDFKGKGDQDPSDGSGHGSHVASILASSDSAYPGVAPGVNIIALKVFNDKGGGGKFSDIEEALKWTVANVSKYNIAAVNMSIINHRNYESEQPRFNLADELAALAGMNVIVAAAAGNDFYDHGSTQGVTYPAADPNAIAVSAVFTHDAGPFTYDDGARVYSSNTDHVAAFTQRHAQMTTVLGPGAPIVGANAEGGTKTMHGTSQAAPYVAGTAVLMQQLAQTHLGRGLAADEFVTLMRDSADWIVDGDDESDNVVHTGLSFPRLNVYALAEAVYDLATSPLSVEAGASGSAQTISGSAFHDANGNGSFDADEHALQNRIVYLDLNNNGQRDSVSHIYKSAQNAATTIPSTKSTVTSTIEVDQAIGAIVDVNVTIDITHTRDKDLIVVLFAPDGRRVELFSKVGGKGDGFDGTVLDDQAARPMPSGTAPFVGTYRPEGSLAGLNGPQDPGIWTLEITDKRKRHGGALNAWSLELTGMEPTELTDSEGRYGFDTPPIQPISVRQVLPTGWSASNPTSDRGYVVNTISNQNISAVNLGSRPAGASVAPGAAASMGFNNPERIVDVLSETAEKRTRFGKPLHRHAAAITHA